MKTNSKSIVRAVSTNASANKTIGLGSASMFLGPKVLGELRILMRLAAASTPRNGLSAAH